ncbi:MAG: hypothetical protein ABWK02_06060 [Aquificaceae bacterium]|mgnify:FL=1|jgi:hypothetical protein|nr:hypothetical protein [Aquificaceae bacterium]HCO38481.1 hypothetical protein [Aquificaceae bacterium]
MKVYRLWLLSLFFTAGCQFLPWNNPCSSDHALREVKKGLAIQIYVENNPEKALSHFFISMLSAFSGQDNTEKAFESEIEPIVKKLELKDVSKPTKKSEKEYMCSAVFEYEGQKRVVEYEVKEIHSGKEKLYKVEIIDTNKVE